MKKAIAAFVCTLLLLFAFPLRAHADLGPKPSVVIDFRGLEGETYYATLLSSVASTGPHAAPSAGNGARYREGGEGYDIFLKFAGYEDADGFYFLQYFQDCSDTQQFTWTYYPPQQFKILLYFPAADRFVSSGRYGRYAFDSYFTADVSGLERLDAQGGAAMAVKQAYDAKKEALSLAARTLITIAAELGIALLFGFRGRKELGFFALVNIATQAALNVALNNILYHAGRLAFEASYVLLELAVFAIEAILYTAYLKKRGSSPVPGWKPWVYALAANFASYALGLGLARWIPQIF